MSRRKVIFIFPKRPPHPNPMNTHSCLAWMPFCFTLLASCECMDDSFHLFLKFHDSWQDQNQHNVRAQKRQNLKDFYYLFFWIPWLTGNYSISWSSSKCCLTICKPLLSEGDTDIGKFSNVLRMCYHWFCQEKLINLLITVK